ncbi:SdrD B-like domain-containing protein [uncultured Methylobacterium sp.]|jgi:Ca2+-binding RTX toxin-like protein/uncharacterized protein (DUF2141 family)|uniref:SdrD B-like domain-containing protein n=1 Tax=uncultured Methylobacterium sp. TaxID=157278 RepID=UPI0026092E34|nr:SdrD B-like domain-containing protein [uncultured Methylobacterium sp.]
MSGSIRGTTFFDNNNNGVQDPGEFGVGPGFVVDLLSGNGRLLQSTTTDGSGVYHFSNLKAGTYSLQFHTSNNFRGTSPSSYVALPNNYGTTPNVTVLDGATTAANDGFVAEATIVGTFFNDANRNARFDNDLDPRVGNVRVNLYDSSNVLVASTVSSNHDFQFPGAEGVFRFAHLRPGTYTVQAVALDGTVVIGASSQVVTVGAGATNYSFIGLLPTAGSGSALPASTIAGRAYADANGDGRFDAGDTGLAGASVVLRDASGYALGTTVAGNDGSYSFSGLYSGNYQVTIGTPRGMSAGTAGNTVATGAIGFGQVVGNLDLGFTQGAPADANGAIPASDHINVVLRGQSNTFYTTSYNLLPVLRQRIEQLLGFDGTNQSVNIIANYQSPDGANTEYGGTSMLPGAPGWNWLDPVNGNYQNGWNATFRERGVLSAVGTLSADRRDDPTAVVWLHNESDSYVPRVLTTAEWESAARYEAGLVRAILGQDASTVPYMFVNAIPFPPSFDPQYASQPANNQTIKVGQSNLIGDTSFNASYAVYQSGDVTMNADDPNVPNGAHINLASAQAYVERIARSVAEQFRNSARPGSPVAAAGGDIDNVGPQVVAAQIVFGQPNQLLLTLQQDGPHTLASLSANAAAGAGWSLRTDAGDATANATATGAQLVPGRPDQLLLTFDTAIGGGDRLFYAWGGDRIALTQGSNPTTTGNGVGSAVYDDQGMPAWIDARGLGITLPPSDYVLTGTQGPDVLRGGAGNDTLDGGAGNDTLIGGAGNDVYRVQNAGDLVVEAAGEGIDTVRTTLNTLTIAAFDNVENLTYDGSLAFTGTGNDIANLITGGIGSDRLDGGIGADTLVGGLGNDAYVVDTLGDVVREQAGQGFDTVLTLLTSYTLGDNVEALTYTGSRSFTGTGNDLANLITGGDRADRLNGKAGADTMVGGRGNDTYVVDNASDVVVERAGEGIDRVLTGVSYTLGDNVENLGMGTSASLSGTGNGLANLLVGNKGHNVLDGRGGADTLTGGLGRDTFVLRAGETVGDTITDFVRGTDTLAFYGFGTDAVLSHGAGSDLYTVTSGDGLTSGSFRLTGVTDLPLSAGAGNADARFFA